MHKVIRIYLRVMFPLMGIILIPYVFCGLYFTFKYNNAKDIHPLSRIRSLRRVVYPGETLLYALPGNIQCAQITLLDNDQKPIPKNSTNGLRIHTYGQEPLPTNETVLTVRYDEERFEAKQDHVSYKCFLSYLIKGSEINGSITLNESSKCLQRLEVMNPLNYVKMSYGLNYSTLATWTGEDNKNDDDDTGGSNSGGGGGVYKINISETYYFCAVAECSDNETVSFSYNFTKAALTYDTHTSLFNSDTSCKLNSLVGHKYLSVTNTNLGTAGGTLPAPIIHVGYNKYYKVVIPLLIWLTPLYILVASFVIVSVCWFCIFREGENGSENYDFYYILDRASEKSNSYQRVSNSEKATSKNTALLQSNYSDDEVVSYYVSGSSSDDDPNTSEKARLLL